MIQKRDFDEAVEDIVARDTRFHPDAYGFVRDSLDYTLKKAGEDISQGRHVSGPELLDGFRIFSIDQFGPMVMTVFTEWGLRCTRDIGEIVFNLIEVGIFGKTESDTLDDFSGVYEFHTAFDHPFLPASRLEELLRLQEEGQLADRS